MTSTTEERSSLFSQSDGAILIGSARESILSKLNYGKLIVPDALNKDPRFDIKLGCFVTLKHYDYDRSLRGCIGFPEPVFKLSKALPEAAVAAAISDPRFPPVELDELDSLLVEVSVLTKPQLISVSSQKDVAEHINLGKDGLIMKWSFGSGLLLPQVATEYKWDAEEFLCNLSMKAGAPPDQWLIPGTQIFKFQALVFGETSPKGKVLLSE